MPEPLTQADMQNLRHFAEAGDLEGYYGLLRDKGYPYGNLALDVVRDDGLPGITARQYADRVGREHGTQLTDRQWLALSIELMKADFDRRSTVFERGKSDVTLQGADIKDYHSKVFEDFGLPPHAWTPYLALGNAQTREERAEAERIWGLMLNQDGGGYADEGLEFFGILHDRAAAERRRRRDEGRDMSDLGNDPKNEPASYLLQRIQPDFGDLLWEGFQDMGDWMISPFSQKEVGANERQTAAYRTRLKAKRPVQQEELALRASAASRSSNSLARQSGLGRASGRSPFAQNRAFGSLGKFKSTPQESADPYELRKKVQWDRVGAPTAHRKIAQNPSGLAPSAPPSDRKDSPE